MNERIKELLTPKLKEWGGASGDNFSGELEKFAELIVRECIENIEQFDHHITPAMEVVPTMVSLIKRNFGVLE